MAIVITISSETEAKWQAASVLWFEGVIKKIENYWDVGPGSVSFRCCSIEHECQNSCGDKLEKYTICAKSHQVVNTNVEWMNIVREEESYAFMLLFNALIVKVIIQPNYLNICLDKKLKYKLIKIKLPKISNYNKSPSKAKSFKKRLR